MYLTRNAQQVIRGGPLLGHRVGRDVQGHLGFNFTSEWMSKSPRPLELHEALGPNIILVFALPFPLITDLILASRREKAIDV